MSEECHFINLHVLSYILLNNHSNLESVKNEESVIQSRDIFTIFGWCLGFVNFFVFPSEIVFS